MTGVYPSTEKLKNAGITGKVMNRIMETALERGLQAEKETMPEHLIRQYGLVPLHFAIRNIHFPRDLNALEKSFPAGSVLEINTGGVARGYREEFYLAPFLLKRWKELGGEIILTADAHTADGLLFAFDRAAEYAKACGFDRAAVLNARGQLEFCKL